MIGRELFEGKTVRLAAIDPESDAAAEAMWTQNLDYVRMNYAMRIPRPLTIFQMKKIYEELGKGSESSELKNHFEFAVRTLENDQLVGIVKITSIEWTNASGTLQLGFNDMQNQAKFGGETLQLMLEYIFREINLYSLMIVLPAYEKSTIQYYERQGFAYDVCQRDAVFADGRYWDKCYLSILQDEWIMSNKEVID